MKSIGCAKLSVVTFAVCVALVLASACGRFAFDDVPTAGDANVAMDAVDARPPCTTVGHDEDGDAIDDACDVCPHVSDVVQGDGDGDGVGDACDPEPAVGRQQLMLFEPFTSLGSAWTAPGGEQVVGDQLQLNASTTGRFVYRALVPAHDTFVIGGAAGTGTGTHLVSISTQPMAPPGMFYCELFDNTVTTQLNFTYSYDNANYTTAPSQLATRFANGSGTLTYEIDNTTGRCSSTWRGATNATMGARPAGIDAEIVMLYAEGVDVRIDYFVQIRTFD